MRTLTLFVLSGCWILQAQDTGWITGSVGDPSGAAIPKATVNLMLHGGSRSLVTTVTNAAGLFTLQALRPVYYDLTVDAPGFQQYKTENLKVGSVAADGSSGDQDWWWRRRQQSVKVTAGLETVQTTSSGSLDHRTAEQIERLPVGDRNPLAFITTQAGVSPGNANGYETDINGQRSSFSNVTLDGINIQDNYIRTGDLDYTPNEPLLEPSAGVHGHYFKPGRGFVRRSVASELHHSFRHQSISWRRSMAESQQRFRGQRFFR